MKKRLRAIYFLLLVFTVVSSAGVVHGAFCAQVFTEKTSKAQYPGSAYFKFPAGVIPQVHMASFMDALGMSLDQTSFEFGAQIPLPEIVKSDRRSVPLAIDFDVAQLSVQDGAIMGRLDASLKNSAPQKKSPMLSEEKLFETQENLNSVVAVRTDLFNDLIKSSFGDLEQHPIFFEVEGASYRLLEAPKISASPNSNSRSSRILLKMTTDFPMSSLSTLKRLGAGMLFKKQIRVTVAIEAELSIAQDNSVSMQMIAVQKEGFELDQQTMRTLSSFLHPVLHEMSLKEIDKVNQQFERTPMRIDSLFKLRQQMGGLHLQLANIFLDQDGYIKMQLNIQPKKQSTETKWWIRALAR